HQLNPALDEANGSVAQVVGFPAALWNAPGAKQNFCYLAICTAVVPRIESAKRLSQPLATLDRQQMKRQTLWPAFERAPQPSGSMHAYVKIVIERQLCDKRSANDRRRR